MALPIAAIVSGATELIKLAVDVIDAHNNNATQEELNEKWAAMQAHLRAANARWEAAGGQQ